MDKSKVRSRLVKQVFSQYKITYCTISKDTYTLLARYLYSTSCNQIINCDLNGNIRIRQSLVVSIFFELSQSILKLSSWIKKKKKKKKRMRNECRGCSPGPGSVGVSVTRSCTKTRISIQVITVNLESLFEFSLAVMSAFLSLIIREE